MSSSCEQLERASYRVGVAGRYDRGVRTAKRHSSGLITGLALLAAALGGCAKPAAVTPDLTFDASRYPDIFQATKDTLRDYQFELEQVDARGGVITTWPRQWAGFATPWIPQATDADSAVVGLMQHELRSCRVTFGTAEGPADRDSNIDLREVTGPMTATVEVTIYRVQRPGLRIGAPSVRLRSHAIDPQLVEEGRQPQFVSSAGPDNALAARIAQAISGAPAQAVAAEELSQEEPQ